MKERKKNEMVVSSLLNEKLTESLRLNIRRIPLLYNFVEDLREKRQMINLIFPKDLR